MKSIIRNLAPKFIVVLLPLALLLFFSLVSIVQIFELTVLSLNVVPSFLSHSFSEYLINYSGGFVRRGLLGEVLSFIGEGFIIPTFNSFLFILFITSLSFLIYLARLVTTSYFVPAIAILMPAGLVSISIFHKDYTIFARKEMLFYCFTIYCAAQSVKIYRSRQKHNNDDHLLNAKINVLIGQIFVFSFLAMLVHEGFAFFTAPTLFILLSFNTLTRNQKYRLAVLGAYLTLIFLMSVILFLNHGTSDIASNIIASLPENVRTYHEAIDSLGLSAGQAVAQVLVVEHVGLYNDFLIAFSQALPIIGISLLLFSFLCRRFSRHGRSSIDPITLGVVVFLFGVLTTGSSFFVMGDWGRLVVSIAINSLLLILVFSDVYIHDFNRTCVFHKIRNVEITKIRFISEASLVDKKITFLVVLGLFWMGLVFRMANCCRYPYHIKMHGIHNYLEAVKDLILFYRLF